MEFTSTDGERRYAELVRVASRAVVGLDFDGTLSPIVDDPERAHIHDDAPDVLLDLAREVGAVAVITGRPARQVLDLGGLEEVGEALANADADLYVFGQYGNERWSSHQRRIMSPRPPRGLASF
ncbi:trehalose-phosphatase, partial [Nocardioides hankookensis]